MSGSTHTHSGFGPEDLPLPDPVAPGSPAVSHSSLFTDDDVDLFGPLWPNTESETLPSPPWVNNDFTLPEDLPAPPSDDKFFIPSEHLPLSSSAGSLIHPGPSWTISLAVESGDSPCSLPSTNPKITTSCSASPVEDVYLQNWKPCHIQDWLQTPVGGNYEPDTDLALEAAPKAAETALEAAPGVTESSLETPRIQAISKLHPQVVTALPLPQPHVPAATGMLAPATIPSQWCAMRLPNQEKVQKSPRKRLGRGKKSQPPLRLLSDWYKGCFPNSKMIVPPHKTRQFQEQRIQTQTQPQPQLQPYGGAPAMRRETHLECRGYGTKDSPIEIIDGSSQSQTFVAPQVSAPAGSLEYMGFGAPPVEPQLQWPAPTPLEDWQIRAWMGFGSPSLGFCSPRCAEDWWYWYQKTSCHAYWASIWDTMPMEALGFTRPVASQFC